MTVPNGTSSSIDEKVAGILSHSQRFAQAAAAKDPRSKVVSLLEFAQQLAMDGNFTSAFVQIARAYAVDPTIPEIAEIENLLRARQQHQTGQHGMHSSAGQAPGIDMLIAEAQRAVSEGRWEEANVWVRRAYAEDPLNDAVAAVERSITDQEARAGFQDTLEQIKRAIHDRDLPAAEGLLRTAFETDPLHEELAALQSQLHRETRTSITPAERHLLHAHRFLEQGEWAEAFAEVRAGLSYDPFNVHLTAMQERIRSASQQE